MARNILDTIRSVADDAEDFENVLNLISRLADDREPSVRSELMEQVYDTINFMSPMSFSHLYKVTIWLAIRLSLFRFWDFTGWQASTVPTLSPSKMSI